MTKMQKPYLQRNLLQLSEVLLPQAQQSCQLPTAGREVAHVVKVAPQS